MTVYALSIENFDKRPKREVNYLLSLARKEIKDAIKNKNHFIHKDKVKMTFFGKLEVLPKDLQKEMKTLMKQTENYPDYVINVAVAYGGRQEILDACRNIAKEVEKGKLKASEINESVIKRNLYTNGYADPDLIIRTSEQRLSGFLLWQTAYSEFAFIDTLWPDLTKKQFFQAINNYSKRERRLGQ